jgi:hypothetical protein
LTAGFIVAAAIMGAPGSHGAERAPGQEEFLSDVAQASTRHEPFVKKEGEREVSNASAV